MANKNKNTTPDMNDNLSPLQKQQIEIFAALGEQRQLAEAAFKNNVETYTLIEKEMVYYNSLYEKNNPDFKEKMLVYISLMITQQPKDELRAPSLDSDLYDMMLCNATCSIIIEEKEEAEETIAMEETRNTKVEDLMADIEEHIEVAENYNLLLTNKDTLLKANTKILRTALDNFKEEYKEEFKKYLKH